ncbi:Threonylcarbamoyladenosine tRNA methylthiotransferase MtaB [Candidatus Filomicrobium marinum]|uniref:Threonylcarbamoyladenosine tRNA methylthiotransferase MtaB n=2 Tax=Hyphomicrobiaceae TaxID=45401 RepID=A0A0D6JCY3_9HYPH|nr:Threonylcarbamoyladenosine tRNA methylthiotransferase MtaB [Candidatus Filomicrobium marinum]CPR16603.1 Threonylcarbamoyladenosine tRNA methylthiotransferase MtaB [Candidatus Filomicrobium marinum]
MRMTEPTIITLGCRLNTYESEVMRRHANDAGLEDTVIINTCAVTAEAVRQAKQTIRKMRRDRPNARIIVTGCAAQIEPEKFAELAEVDHVIGNAEKLQADTFKGLSLDESERVVVNDIMSVTETAAHMIDSFGSRTRAYVQVQNGCDHRCTFCIIPYGRGPSRSVPAGEVVNEIRRLVENGYPEIVLTGVDMTAYGRDLPGQMTLGKLVRKVLNLVPELRRLRLSSIDQVEADPDLMDAIAEEDRLMPHLHLSMQAGDDMILKRMKRRHTSSDAIAFCERVRAMRPDVAFGADLIAGFPTETDEMFANTMRIAEACGLTYLHVFPFSPRTGTPAARMPQVAKPVIKQRAAQLRELGDRLLTTYLNSQTGRTFETLMEKPTFGRTEQFTEILIEDINAEPGVLMQAKVIGHDGRRLVGEAVV